MNRISSRLCDRPILTSIAMVLLVFAMGFSLTGCSETTVETPTEPGGGGDDGGGGGGGGGGNTTVTVTYTCTPVEGSTSIQCNGQWSPTDVDPVETWQYTLLDGERELATKSGQNVNFSVADQTDPCRTYLVQLTVTLRDGFILPNPPPSQEVTIPDSLCTEPPDASFQTTANGLTVTFTNTSSGTFDDVLWNFGDGFTSSAASPTHTYQQAGTYTVQLTVTNEGGSDTATDTITVAPPPPQAGFQVTINGLTVTFTNTSSGDFDDVLWNFGDTFTSNEISPTHTYGAAGTYTVQLTVTGDGGSDQQITTITLP